MDAFRYRFFVKMAKAKTLKLFHQKPREMVRKESEESWKHATQGSRSQTGKATGEGGRRHNCRKDGEASKVGVNAFVESDLRWGKPPHYGRLLRWLNFLSSNQKRLPSIHNLPAARKQEWGLTLFKMTGLNPNKYWEKSTYPSLFFSPHTTRPGSWDILCLE